MGRTRQQASDEMQLHVSRHAIERYMQRASGRGRGDQVAREIMEGVRDAIDFGLLFAAGRLTYLAPLAVRGGPRVCAILDVRGPAEKPFAVTVRTVFTMAMATARFGHIPGLVPSMEAALLSVA
jgi:hypothetical protein